MLWRWRHEFQAKILISPSKTQFFALVHHLVSPPVSPTDNNPKRSFRLKSLSGEEQVSQTPRTTYLTPQSVQTTLRSCPSDLIALRFFLWCSQQPHYFHDKPTFRYMVPVVSNLTQLCGTVKSIVRELEMVGCVVKAQTLLLLMRIYWDGAMYGMVFEAFEEMSSYGYIPNTYARNIVMDVLFKIGRSDVALKVLEETQAPNFLSFNIAVCNLCKSGDVDNVKRVLRCMLTKGYYLNPDSYPLVLNCFCKFARLAEALQLLDVMIVSGVPVSVNVWSILIDGFCKSGQIEVASYLLEKMVDVGCGPNIVTCTSLIKGFLESRMPGKALEILSAMESRGCFPDLVLCNVLIDSLSKIGRYNDAFEVFSSMRELRLTPDVYTYSSLISTICLSKQYVLLPLLTSGLTIQPDLVVCNCLLNYFCKAGYPEGAIEFYNDMIDRGFQPDKYSYAGVLSALCRLGRIHEAVNVYHGMIRQHPGLDAHIHTIITSGLIKTGNFHKAIKVFKQAMRANVPLDVVWYNVAIDGLLGGGQMEEAHALIRKMKQMKIVPNKQSYNLIVCGFCKNGDINMVIQILQEMVDKKIELDNNTYRMMKNLLSHSTYSNLAFDLFIELRNLGLLPKEERLYPVARHDNFSYSCGSRDILGLGTSSSDDLSDAAVSVG